MSGLADVDAHGSLASLFVVANADCNIFVIGRAKIIIQQSDGPCRRAGWGFNSHHLSSSSSEGLLPFGRVNPDRATSLVKAGSLQFPLRRRVGSYRPFPRSED